MVGKTHIVGGLALASLLSLSLYKTEFIDEENLIVQQATLLASSGLGALLPDIDHKNSSVSHQAPLVSFFVRLFFTHRGFLHSPLCMLLLTAACYVVAKAVGSEIGYWIGEGVVIGYASHLLLDSLNPTGIPLFYPYKKKFSFGRVKTGGFMENMVILSLLGVAIVCEGVLVGVISINT